MKFVSGELLILDKIGRKYIYFIQIVTEFEYIRYKASVFVYVSRRASKLKEDKESHKA